MKRKVVTYMQVHWFNQGVLGRAGEHGSQAAILETIGRKSGVRRQIPISPGLAGDIFWIAAHHGREAAYVRNLEANPRVRVKVEGGWRTGTATIMPEEDALGRLRSVAPRNATAAKLLGTDLLAIRVDLDPIGRLTQPQL